MKNLFLLTAIILPLPVKAIPIKSTLPSIHAIKKINLNTANVNLLMHSFPKIGKQRAIAIVNYRKTHGLFKSVEELANIRGLGKKFVKIHLVQLLQIYSIAK